MKDFDAVVFDMDGVIFDSETATMACWQELAQKYGIGEIEETYHACIGTTRTRTKEIVQQAFGRDFPFERYEEEAEKLFQEKYSGGRLPVKPGVREILLFLKDRKIKTALATSTEKNKVISQLRDAGLADYFDVIVTGDMVARSKPAPDIFLLACEMVGAPPERTVAIEDSYNGIRAAQAGGLIPLMVPDMLPATGEMRELSEAVLEDLNGVIAYFQA